MIFFATIAELCGELPVRLAQTKLHQHGNDEDLAVCQQGIPGIPPFLRSFSKGKWGFSHFSPLLLRVPYFHTESHICGWCPPILRVRHSDTFLGYTPISLVNFLMIEVKHPKLNVGSIGVTLSTASYSWSRSGMSWPQTRKFSCILWSLQSHRPWEGLC